ncbi:MAG: hypothetical protein LC792_02450 [Actinobacteria bacterium]|nr:hypothetical protein [Actinomycetota bacterium]
MRSTRQRLAAVTLLGGLTTLGIGLSVGPASAAIDDCTGYVGKAQSGSLHITAVPAAGSEAPVGSDVALQATWDDNAWSETDSFYVCGTLDGAYSEALSSQDRGVANNGSYSAAASIPASTPVGSDVCFLGVVKGRLADETQGKMLSETVCYRTAAAVEPTTTTSTTTTTVTTEAPVVAPAVVDAGAPSAPAVEAAPAPAVEPAPLPELPRTGTGVDVLAGLGGFTLALGGLTRFLGRRRPSEA